MFGNVWECLENGFFEHFYEVKSSFFNLINFNFIYFFQ